MQKRENKEKLIILNLLMGADLIIEHADIRRSLLNMKSIIEGERALCFWLSQQTEVSLYHNR